MTDTQTKPNVDMEGLTDKTIPCFWLTHDTEAQWRITFLCARCGPYSHFYCTQCKDRFMLTSAREEPHRHSSGCNWINDPIKILYIHSL